MGEDGTPLGVVELQQMFHGGLERPRFVGAAGPAADASFWWQYFETPAATGPSPTRPGRAGDVYLCHPFLVHAANWPHRGTTPRIIAQPGVLITEPFPLTNRTDAYPVEATILDALSTLGRDAPKQNA